MPTHGNATRPFATSRHLVSCRPSLTTIVVSASGKATISLNRTLEDGSVQEADVKDIKSPNYFGEGRVLGDSRAYASVRAKEELVVYYIVRADVEQLVRCGRPSSVGCKIYFFVSRASSFGRRMSRESNEFTGLVKRWSWLVAQERSIIKSRGDLCELAAQVNLVFAFQSVDLP